MQVIRQTLMEVIAWDTEVRFVIPRWQRHYVWSDEEVLQMWWDWCEDCARDQKHFSGVMLFREIAEARVKSWEIVDGQQRMTTFFLFFIALRDVCAEKKINFTELSRIFTVAGAEECRLVLQEGMNEDREVMNALLAQKLDCIDKEILQQSALEKGYRIFRQQLGDLSAEAIPPFVLKVLQNVDLVVLTVDAGDDARRIFSALNSRGKQISPEDLVASMITLIGQDDRELNDRARDSWNLVTNLFDQDDLGVFLDTFGRRNGVQTDRGTAFEEIKFELVAAKKENRVRDWLREFKRAAKNYNDILFPETDSDDPTQDLLKNCSVCASASSTLFCWRFWKPFVAPPPTDPSCTTSWRLWSAS